MRKLRPGALVPALLVAVLTVVCSAGLSSASAATPSRSFGVTLPGVPGDLSGLQQLSSELGRSPDTVMWYASWAYDADFPATAAQQVAATGAAPEVTWEPWDPSAGVDQPAYALDRITAGDFDGYIGRWAREIKAFRKTVVLRFAHEMNGNWYPWAEGVNGNGPGDYVAAWRHVRGIFSANGVKNVVWMWSPNVPYPGSTELAALYPGDAYVDRVALDGYNWGTSQSWSTWQTFWEVFADGVTQLQALTSRPIWIGEVASTETGGDKAAWIADMFATLGAHPEIRGFTWFDFDKETDWRIDSSPGALDAFRTGLAGYR